MSAIDDIIASYPAVAGPVLLHIRAVILEQYPEATETTGYGMPVCKLRGKYLLGFAAFKDHLSIFPGSEVIAELAAELSAYKCSKGTIQF